MHFGLFCLNTQRDASKTPRDIYRETMEHVRLAEQVGFEIAWFAEHHFSNYCLCPSPLTMTSYAAGLTTRIKLGPAVVVVPLYEPIRLLEDIGFADQLSEGRLVLGFGTGYQEYEFHKFGVDLKEGRDIFFETLDFIEAYFRGEPLSFEGKYIKMPETYFSVRTVQKRPPVYIAGMAGDPKAQGRSVERGYIPFFTTGWNKLEVTRQIKAKVAEAYGAAGGEVASMPFAMQRYVFVTHDKKAALRAADGARYVRRIAQAMRGKYGELDGSFLRETPAADEPPLEDIVERLLIGDPATVAEKLSQEIEALEPCHISCFMGIPGLSQAETLASIERFGTEVVPLVEKRFGPSSGLGASAKQTKVEVA
jgi:alkanesulfonate monooxygenase SsuD/methylene tetrahydromethanopterin reductase-like flavin-dependent oxidoreductase (luciferase family)